MMSVRVCFGYGLLSGEGFFADHFLLRQSTDLVGPEQNKFGHGGLSLYYYSRQCGALLIFRTPSVQTTDSFLSGKFHSLRQSEHRRSSSRIPIF
jgi:hypothetical protein